MALQRSDNERLTFWYGNLIVDDSHVQRLRQVEGLYGIALKRGEQAIPLPEPVRR